MIQVSCQSSEHKRKNRVTLTVSIVFVLVFVAVGKDLRFSLLVTNKYVPNDQSQIFMHETGTNSSSDNPSSTRRSSPVATDTLLLNSNQEEMHTSESLDEPSIHTDRVHAEQVLHNDALSKNSTGTTTANEIKAAERETRNLNYAYRDATEMHSRSTRFPSVDDRVKLYMSNWYTPPCPFTAANEGDDDYSRIGFVYSRHNSTTEVLTLREIAIRSDTHRSRRIWQLDSHFNGSSTPGSFDQVHFMDRNTMLACKHRYCRDMVAFLFPALERVSGLYSVPILFQFGDDNRTTAFLLPRNATELPQRDLYPQMPVLKKMRKCMAKSELERITSKRCTTERIVPNNYRLEPIVMKLKTQRHYGRINDIAKFDVSWDEKKNAAIFRGKLTGNYPVQYTNEYKISNLTVHERCRLLERCWIVYQHGANNSTLVDAKLALPFTPNNVKLIPRFLALENGDTADSVVDLYADTVSLSEMLQYKALIMLEGNDVSSGLKWALFSNSVVMMPEPTLISWAMEEMLEPWVHYVPIHVDTSTPTTAITDVEQKMQWIMNNDDKARQIARAGKLWIADLVVHPAVPKDEAAIFDDILRRYATHFVPALQS